MSGYAKVFSSILDSSIWAEPYATRIVWVTMLAMANARGLVEASASGIAHRARVTREECDAALRALQAPDPESRTVDHDGRRVDRVDGGWQILNHAKYRHKRDEDARREYQAEWIAKKRAKTQPVDACRQVSTMSTQAEAEAEANKKAHTARARGRAHVAKSEPSESVQHYVDPRAVTLEGELSKHRTTRTIGDPGGFAAILLGRIDARGTPFDVALGAIAEAAADMPEGVTEAEVRRKVRTYVDNAKRFTEARAGPVNRAQKQMNETLAWVRDLENEEHAQTGTDDTTGVRPIGGVPGGLLPGRTDQR